MSSGNPFFWILLFSLGAMLVNTIGIYVIYRSRRWAERALETFMCFAAGMLIASPLIMAFPEAVGKNPQAGIAALAGFVFMYMSNRIIKKRTKTKELAFGITAVQGILIHSLLDGAVYTVTFSVSVLTGMLTGLGLVVHEFAEGVVTFTMLLKSGASDKKAAVYAFFAAALTTPIGALIACPAISRVSDPLLGLALGFVSGVLIYISAAHLLPEAGAHDKEHSVFSFFAGVGLALLLLLIE